MERVGFHSFRGVFFYFLYSSSAKNTFEGGIFSWSCGVSEEKKGLPDRGLALARGYLVLTEQIAPFCWSEMAYSGVCWEVSLWPSHGDLDSQAGGFGLCLWADWSWCRS